MPTEEHPSKPPDWSDERWEEFVTTGPGSHPGVLGDIGSFRDAQFESRKRMRRMRESLKKKFGNNAITEKQARLIIRRALELHYGTKR